MTFPYTRQLEAALNEQLFFSLNSRWYLDSRQANLYPIHYEGSEDTKMVIRIRKSKDDIW
jgi:hypothetical protein